MKTTWKTIALIMIPAIIATLADGLATVLGQNDWNNVAEASPMARPFLALGPFAWILFILIYLSVSLIPPFLVKSRLIVEVYSIYLTTVHCIGFVSWLGIFLPGGLPAVDFYAMIPAMTLFIFRLIFFHKSNLITI